ncbi:MAG TPA: response regulator [Luteolibacter sp.]|nr:response regulator [Luteolibacter sp.]
MSHILIADDDQFLTNVCSRAFEKAGYKTTVANDGHQAVKQLVDQKPDLVLLDLLLPGIDGIGVLKFIRSRPELENLPVFIISNSAYFSGIVQSAWSEGATKFIRKGEFSPNGLVDEVRKTVPPTGYVPAPSPPDLPIDRQPATTKAKTRAKAPKSALIADDDRTIHGVLCYFLGQAGFKIESAFNGLQALEMARQEKPGVLILDVTMPVKDGFETLQEWMADAALRDIPVIMLTASKNEENQSKAIGQGATHYLTKPFSPDTLVQLAEKAISGGS